MKTILIDGVSVELLGAEPRLPEWIGQSEPLRQLLACWMDGVDESDPPLSPRITGVPGVGKTTLAMAGARVRGQSCWVQQCTSDTRPEDLVITPVLGDAGKILYRASPLLSAVVEGGVCVLDEGNRMSEKAWASLAALLDHRRCVDSVTAGVRVQAHPGFRICVTMNEDGSTFDLPDYVVSRLQPRIEIGFPGALEEERILAHHAPRAEAELRAMCVAYLQDAHDLDLPFSVRDGINLVRLATRLGSSDGTSAMESFPEAVRRVLGPEALDLRSLRRSRPGPARTDSDEYFFDPDEDDLRG
ncbi:MAG TPA: MoxR family ATPase [Fibrobacteria bacterium]|nr:MoxR family ATPase [Fibrobacteria bacterium]